MPQGFLIRAPGGGPVSVLSQLWADSQNIAFSMVSLAQAHEAASLAGPLTSSAILEFEKNLRSMLGRLDVIAAAPGIAAYVSGLANTPAGYDVSSLYGAMRTQLAATIQWIHDNLPKDPNGFLLLQTIGANGTSDRTFDTATLASYRAQIDALIATAG